MKKILLTLAFLSTTYVGHAQTELRGTLPDSKEVQEVDELRPHMGLLAGINSPEGSREASPQAGIDVGFQPYIPFGVGIEGSTTEQNDGDENQSTSILAKATYNFGGEVPVLRHSYVGAAAGPTILENTDDEWTVAPLLGFDIPLSESIHNTLSLGLNAKYAFISDTPDALITNVALKYWY